LHSYPIRLASYQTFKKSSSLVQLVTMLCHVIKTHSMVGKGLHIGMRKIFKRENLTVKLLTCDLCKCNLNGEKSAIMSIDTLKLT